MTMADVNTDRPRLKLLSIDGPAPVGFDLVPPDPVTIGRSVNQALVLDDPSVSRAHAKITFTQTADGRQRMMLADAGSTAHRAQPPPGRHGWHR